jgi:hypothetical protein
VLDILLNIAIAEFPTDQSLGVENGVLGVLRSLVLGGISDKTLLLGESYPGWGDTVSLVVSDDFYFSSSLNAIVW